MFNTSKWRVEVQFCGGYSGSWQKKWLEMVVKRTFPPVVNFGKHPLVSNNFVNFFEDENILKITFFRWDLRFASWDLATFKKALDPLWSNVGVLDFWVVCNIYRQTSMKLTGYTLSEGFFFPSIKGQWISEAFF